MRLPQLVLDLDLPRNVLALQTQRLHRQDGLLEPRVLLQQAVDAGLVHRHIQLLDLLLLGLLVVRQTGEREVVLGLAHCQLLLEDPDLLHVLRLLRLVELDLLLQIAELGLYLLLQSLQLVLQLVLALPQCLVFLRQFRLLRFQLLHLLSERLAIFGGVLRHPT